MTVKFSRKRQTGATALNDYDLGSGLTACPEYYMIFNKGSNNQSYHSPSGSEDGP
jgi:hypothetical protein